MGIVQVCITVAHLAPCDSDAHIGGMTKKQSFGEKLKQLLKGRKMSQSELARRTGIDRSTVNRLVNGKRDPSSEELEWIAKVLDVDSEELRKDVEFLQCSPKPSEREAELAARVLQAETRRAEAVRKAETLSAQMQELLDSMAEERRAWTERQDKLREDFEREKSLAARESAQEIAKLEERERALVKAHDVRIEETEREMRRQTTMLRKQLDDANARNLQLVTKLRTVMAAAEAISARNQTLEQQVSSTGGKMLISALVGGLFGKALSGSSGGDVYVEDDDY